SDLICGRITGPFALSERSQVHLAIGLGGARGFWITGLEDDGTFDLALDRARAGQVVERVEVALAEAGSVTAAMAVCEPGVPLPAGPLELGELALEEAPLVASGTVVDATGQPVERVSLSVRPAVPVKGYPTELVHVGREPEGRFTIRGRPASDDLLLVRGLFSFSGEAPVPFRRGATDLRLVVTSFAELGVVVRHDLPFDVVRLLRAELVREGSGDRVRWSGSTSSPTARDARLLRFSTVPPGRYTLHVRLTGDDTPLVRVEGVDIGRGTVEDPRLWSLDIRGKVRLARIRLVDADGRPVMSG